MPESEPSKTPLALDALIHKTLLHGIQQVRAAGSPLHPVMLDEAGQMYLLVREGDEDPMELACQAIKKHAPGIQRCALAIDTRLALADGKKWDAILVMACERGQAEGEVWAQRYVPKGLFRRFRTEGAPEQVGKAKDFISVALED